jgi:hypothetical protein
MEGKKHIWLGLSLVVAGVITYNIYGKEITTSGLRRADGTFFTHRVLGTAMVFLGIIVAFGSNIQNWVLSNVK